MARSINKLTARKVASLNTKGWYGDGNGLWLKVTSSETKSWVFRYSRFKKINNMGLGSIFAVSLADARLKAQEYRATLQEGLDPLQVKRELEAKQKAEKADLVTFNHCAERYIESHKAGWKNAKHAQQWTNTIHTYASPVIGSLPIKSIDTALIMRVLEPIWLTKNETAGRLRGRIENILSWAAVQGYRAADNPAQWKGHLENLLAKPSKIKKVKHHRAMPYTDIHNFINDLRTHTGVSAKALEFLIITASRTSEVIGAQWDEIDLTANVWIIPANRMKAGKEHRVPLCSRALELIEEMKAFKTNDFLFCGQTKAGGLSNAAMDKLLQKTMAKEYTVHGFRSTFRDWTAEQTNYPRDLCEMALAHTIKDKSEAAYRRGDMMEKRFNMMNDWLKYIESPLPKGKVISINDKKVG